MTLLTSTFKRIVIRPRSANQGYIFCNKGEKGQICIIIKNSRITPQNEIFEVNYNGMFFENHSRSDKVKNFEKGRKGHILIHI